MWAKRAMPKPIVNRKGNKAEHGKNYRIGLHLPRPGHWRRA